MILGNKKIEQVEQERDAALQRCRDLEQVIAAKNAQIASLEAESERKEGAVKVLQHMNSLYVSERDRLAEEVKELRSRIPATSFEEIPPDDETAIHQASVDEPEPVNEGTSDLPEINLDPYTELTVPKFE